MTVPGVAETDTTNMGSVASESHERSTKFCFTLVCRQLQGNCRFAGPQSVSLFSSISVVVPGGQSRVAMSHAIFKYTQ